MTLKNTIRKVAIATGLAAIVGVAHSKYQDNLELENRLNFEVPTEIDVDSSFCARYARLSQELHFPHKREKFVVANAWDMAEKNEYDRRSGLD